MFLVLYFFDVVLFHNWLMMYFNYCLLFLMVFLIFEYFVLLINKNLLNNIDVFLSFENSLFVVTMMFIFFRVVHYMNIFFLVMNTLLSQRFCGLSLVHISIMLIVDVNFVNYWCLNNERLWFGNFFYFLYYNFFWGLFNLFDRLRYLSLNSSLEMM